MCVCAAEQSRIRSPGNSSQELLGDTAVLNKVTRSRLFADNEMWILAPLPLFFFFLSIMTNSLLPCILIISYPSYCCMTPWLTDDLPPPSSCRTIALWYTIIYPSMNSPPVSSCLSLSQSPLSCSLIFSELCSFLYNFAPPVQIWCLSSPPLSSLLLTKSSKLLQQVSETGYFSVWCMGQTFKMSVLMSNLTLPPYCFIISPSAWTPDSTNRER